MAPNEGYTINFSCYIRRNNAISTCQLTTKIENIKDISICHTTVWRYMKKKDIDVSTFGNADAYRSHIEMRKTWAQAHLNDFTDQIAFDLLRNTHSITQKSSKSNNMGWFFTKW